MTDAELRKWIDNATYEDLVKKWQTDPDDSRIFKGHVGKHYTKTMQAWKKKLYGSVAA